MPTGNDITWFDVYNSTTSDTTANYTYQPYVSYGYTSGEVENMVTENDFLVRYGVELEFESSEALDYDHIMHKMMNAKVPLITVAPDGSLSEYGFELISQPVESMELLTELMCNALDGLQKNYDIYADSPTAIHIHVSNVKKVTNLFYLVGYFSEVFEHLRVQNRNDLVHRPLKMPKYKHGKRASKIRQTMSYEDMNTRDLKQWVEMGIDPIYAREAVNCAELFMNSRRTTLRYSGWDSGRKTIEFRVFPQRLNKDIYRAYTKIVQKLIDTSQRETLLKIYRRHRSFKQGMKPLYIKLQEFMEMCELTPKEMYMLFHNEDTLETAEGGINPENLPFHMLAMCEEPVTPIEYHIGFFQNNLDQLYRLGYVGGYDTSRWNLFTSGEPYYYQILGTNGLDDVLIGFCDENGEVISDSWVSFNDRDAPTIRNILNIQADQETPMMLSLMPTHNPSIGWYIPRCLVLRRSRVNNYIMAEYNGHSVNIQLRPSIFDQMEALWNGNIEESIRIRRDERRMRERVESIGEPMTVNDLLEVVEPNLDLETSRRGFIEHMRDRL